MGINGFGKILVYGYNLVPFPPAIITTGTSFNVPFISLCTAAFSSRKIISDTTPLAVTTGNAVIEYCCMSIFALFCSFFTIFLGAVFINFSIAACKSPERINHRRISPSVRTPVNFCLLSVTKRIPLALESIFCIASTTVLSEEIKNLSNCSAFIKTSMFSAHFP